MKYRDHNTAKKYAVENSTRTATKMQRWNVSLKTMRNENPAECRQDVFN